MSAPPDGAGGPRDRGSTAGRNLQRGAVLAAVAVAGTLCATLAPGIAAGAASVASASWPAVSWGRAEEVPGLGALNVGGIASLGSLSCRRVGYCSAAGTYTDDNGHGQPFVVNESKGRWGKAEEVPGIAALSARKGGGIGQLSCAAAGYCSAGGSYTDAGGHGQVFVANESKGRWGKAEEVPRTAALNSNGQAQVSTLSCPSAGNCAAGGFYAPYRQLGLTAFVVSESKDRWGKAQPVRGLPGRTAINPGGYLNTLSCPSAGNCAGGGFYTEGFSGYNHAFVLSEKNGKWGQAEQVPGTAASVVWYVNTVSSVSCSSAGNCGAGGPYGHTGAFVVSERNGKWGKAEEAPGTTALNLGGDAAVNSVSCPSASRCVAAGSYTDQNGMTQAFVGGG